METSDIRNGFRNHAQQTSESFDACDPVVSNDVADVLRAAGIKRPLTPPFFFTPPPTSSSEPERDPEPHEAEDTPNVSMAQLVDRIERGGPASYMQMILARGLGDVGDINVTAAYIAGVSSDCGTCSDPLLKMLLQQILISFHRIAQLHMSSSQGRTPEASLAYTSAATKLQAEMRKSMLAFRELQQVPMQVGAYVQRQVGVLSPAEQIEQAAKKKKDTKLSSNYVPEADPENNNEQREPIESVDAKPSPSECRKAKPAKTSGINGRRLPKNPYSDSEAPTMAALNGAAERGW